MKNIKLYAISAIIGVSLSAFSVIGLSRSLSFGDTKAPLKSVSPAFLSNNAEITHPYYDESTKLIASLPAFNSSTYDLDLIADKLKFSSLKTEEFIYFRQNSPEYNNIPYGNETIGSYGCGPTNLAVVATNLTGQIFSPITLAKKSEEWGCFVAGSGTSYAFFQKGAEFCGIKCKNIIFERSEVITHLLSGKMIICTIKMGRGGHFITLRGITENGKILIADTYSEINTYTEWDLDVIIGKLKNSYAWVFSK